MTELTLTSYVTYVTGPTLIHKPGSPADPDLGGVKEASMTTSLNFEQRDRRIDLVRANFAGADWSSIVSAGAYEAVAAAINQMGANVASGFEPQVVFLLGADRQPEHAVLVTSEAELDAAVQVDNARSLKVQRILPFQVGGTAEGAVALCVNADSGIQVRSLHSTQAEARLAEVHVKEMGFTKVALMPVHTPVTKILAQVVAGAFNQKDAASTQAAETSHVQAHAPQNEQARPAMRA